MEISWFVNQVKLLLRKIKMDRAVFFALMARVCSGAIGLVTLFLIVRKFTPELQGYYYTFYNLVALQIFVELGLGTVIIQFASHEWASLRFDEKGNVVGSADALSRLISLARISMRWYVTGGVILTFLLSIFGYLFFSKSHSVIVNWAGPWFVLCLFTGFNILLVPLWSLLEGCNQVKNLYTYRFIQVVCSGLAVLAAILLGAGLWSLSFSTLAIFICAPIFLLRYYKKFLKILIFSIPLGSRISWKIEIFPMQWRIAVSWFSGYFVFCLFTPVLFHYQGPVVAGQFGMTWSLINVVGMVATSWLVPRIPQFGIFIAQKKYKELDKFFWKITRIVSILIFLSSLIILFFIYIINKFNFPLASRLLTPFVTALLLIAQALVVFSMPFSSYLRAHKREPLMILSVLSGLSIGFVTLLLSKYCTVREVAIGYLVVTVIIIPIIFIIWVRCKAIWHTINLT
ncbi:MAG: hypothetical protein PHH68_01790 [Candidatus Omnitrophica bacterium]|nr:hypothetical protein [Candidatus Omnitrophota bacterium]